MTIRVSPVHQNRDEVGRAKARARRAYGDAKAAGGLATNLADKLWAETLMAIEGKNAATRAEMFTRTESLLTLLADRQSWPR